jgi:RNA polymerase sigma-70 factor (ECF subfamily)
MSQHALDAAEQATPRPTGGRLDEFEALYRAEVTGITAFFARRSRNAQEVADLTADTFTEAICSFLTNGPSAGHERAWLYAIARHVFAKHCEQSSRRADALVRHAARHPLAEDEVEELAERIDAEASARRLLESLDDIPELEREAIELVDLAGLTPKEAASALGVAPGALRVRLFRARARLRKESTNDV